MKVLLKEIDFRTPLIMLVGLIVSFILVGIYGDKEPIVSPVIYPQHVENFVESDTNQYNLITGFTFTYDYLEDNIPEDILFPHVFCSLIDTEDDIFYLNLKCIPVFGMISSRRGPLTVILNNSRGWDGRTFLINDGYKIGVMPLDRITLDDVWTIVEIK